MLTYRILDRADNTSQLIIPPLTWDQPSRLRWVAQGGCDRATISASGGRQDIWSMANYLRCPVEITDGVGRNVWWGYINTIKIQDGADVWEISMDTMVNRLAVKYVTIAENAEGTGTQAQTSFLDDLPSQAEFGIKEAIYSAGSRGLTSTAAEAMRASALAISK